MFLHSMDLDVEHLVRCRLVIGRIGEMDKAKWWNTNGVLGPLGRHTLERNFANAHYFAQARIVFTVAAAHSQEVFPLPQDSYSLWSVPPAVEYELSLRWPEWLRAADRWKPFFETIAALDTLDPAAALVNLELASDADAAEIRKLHRSNEFRSVNVPSTGDFSTRDVTRLALAFSHGEEGRPAIPYTRCPTH